MRKEISPSDLILVSGLEGNRVVVGGQKNLRNFLVSEGEYFALKLSYEPVENRNVESLQKVLLNFSRHSCLARYEPHEF